MILEACVTTKNGLIHASNLNIPRIELFARQTSEGWDSWGNEV